jgi:Predicted integral membrane protein (DUF2269)
VSAFVYSALLFLHILSAITAVGSNATYGWWVLRAQAEPANLGFALKGIKFIDDRIANPAYGVLLITGLIMTFMQWKITDLWIIIALVLFVAIAVLGIAFYSPLLKRQIALADAGQTASPEFARLMELSRRFGPGLGVLVVVILVMMVFKPSL